MITSWQYLSIIIKKDAMLTVEKMTIHCTVQITWYTSLWKNNLQPYDILKTLLEYIIPINNIYEYVNKINSFFLHELFNPNKFKWLMTKTNICNKFGISYKLFLKEYLWNLDDFTTTRVFSFFYMCFFLFLIPMEGPIPAGQSFTLTSPILCMKTHVKIRKKNTWFGIVDQV